jgi:hypothetical protein
LKINDADSMIYEEAQSITAVKIVRNDGKVL